MKRVTKERCAKRYLCNCRICKLHQSLLVPSQDSRLDEQRMQAHVLQIPPIILFIYF